MSEKLLILGESGNGKSFSITHCDPSITAVVSPVGKKLPKKSANAIPLLKGEVNVDKIINWIRKQVKDGKKLIVIDDFQYIMSVPYMHRIQETGWDKYNDFGKNYFDLIDLSNELPDDVLMVYMSHTETLEDGVTRIKLIGKLLREKITIEGLFETVLGCKKIDDGYYFITQSNGKDTIKSPYEMFDSYAIDNNLNYVYERIKNYYEFGDYKSDEVIREMSDEVATDIEKPQKRTRTTTETSEKPKRGRGKSRMEKKIEEGVGNKNEDDPFSSDFLKETMPVIEEKPFESDHAKNLEKAIAEQKAAKKVESDPLPDEFNADEVISKVDKLEEELVTKPKRRERKRRN